MENKKLILAVAANDETGSYSVDIPAGSNAAETAFAMAVVIRCFVKDGVIDNPKIMLDLITKYATEEQYDQVQ